MPLLDDLNLQQKQVLELRYLKDWSFEQIAQNLNTSESNIRQIVSRSLKKLKNTMKGANEK